MNGYNKEVIGRNKRLAYTLDNTLSHMLKEGNSKRSRCRSLVQASLSSKKYVGNHETMQTKRKKKSTHPQRNQRK